MSIARHHAEWLSLVEQSGPFLSLPVLLRVMPQGLDAHDPDQHRILKLAHEEWQDACSDPAIHRAWVRFVLTQTLEMPEDVLAEGQAISAATCCDLPEHGETLRPDLAILIDNKPHLLIQVYPTHQDLDRSPSDRRWKEPCGTRMMELLHATGVRLGLVTNGERWILVYAPRGETTGFASWYASYWFEEPITLRAFRTLLSARRFFNAPENDTLAAMFSESANNQQEATDQLGDQVRKAVEVLIQSLDRADQDHGRQLLGDVAETELYEAALTVMMRLVILFSAEERGLLLLGDQLYDQHYAVSTLRDQLREDADLHGEEVVERRLDAWVRLLSTFRAVASGIEHQRLTLPAYGGHLFDPDRFSFLEGRKKGTSWLDTLATPLPVNNRTVLHLLEALQILQVKVPGGGPAQARRLSFRALDIENIGHVYEGLLDHTAKRATEAMLGLTGTKDKEPEIALAELERGTQGENELLAFLKEATGRSIPALKKGLKIVHEGQDASRFRSSCGNDAALWEQVKPFAGLVRLDTFDYPVVIPAGSVYVTEGSDRRSTGTHYTPRSLTGPIVQYALEPLVYEGPAEGKPREDWKLKSARELLSLKVCDMATGSGAFLVQACRYLSERLMEAWEQSEVVAGHARQQSINFVQPRTETARQERAKPRITPFGDAARGRLDEQLIPVELGDRIVYAQRLVAQRCLYGVDKNPMAVEMAKLSLWLLTLAKGQPFTFLDHAIRCGDSLVGIHDLDQLRHFDLRGKVDQPRYAVDSVRGLVDKATELRLAIEERAVRGIEDVHEQERMLREATDHIERLRIAADLLLAEGFGEGDQPFICMSLHFKDADVATFRREAMRYTKGRPAFHWPLEFPEVFARRGGFDAFVGNPPFMHGSWISSRFGDDYARHLRQRASGLVGKIDYVIYFLRRAALLVRNGGTIGLLLTDKANEGDARHAGFEHLLNQGFSIYQAATNIPWPGVASVLVCRVHLHRGKWCGAALNSALANDVAVVAPKFLHENEGAVYLGAKPDSLGFILEPQVAESYLKDERYRPVLRPYYSGSDLNDLPSLLPPRYIIDFNSCDLAEAQQFSLLFSIVEREVKPKRLTLKRAAYRDRWWQFTEPQLSLFFAIRRWNSVLAMSRVSKHFIIRFVPSNAVYSDKVVVFVRNTPDAFSVLSSAIHLCWGIENSTTHGSGSPEYKNYKPTECGRTFPFPPLANSVVTTLGDVGSRLNTYREQAFVRTASGPTSLYNRFHGPTETSDDISKLRQLHVEMDQTVAAAYGWTDLDLGHSFHETRQGVRYTISEPARLEVLARLLKLNHERYAQEVALGLHEKKKASKPKGRKKQETPELFDRDGGES